APSIASSPGLLIGIADTFGRLVSVTYDASNRVNGVIDPNSGQFVYAYSTAGDLGSVQYPGGGLRTYLYNEPAYTSGYDLPHALTGIVDENGGRFATFAYSPSGTPLSTEHAGGVNKYRVSY